MRIATLCTVFLCTLVASAQVHEPALPKADLATQHFGADAPWFLPRIPFFEIDDPEIQQIYYYRWKLYRSHIREIGDQGTTVTEFLTDVPWAREPYTDLNDSASFHLLEGRWLRDPTIINNLIDHLYTGGGNDRHFSESIAAATEATTRVTGDPAPALRHLDTMQYVYNQWDDHFDRTRNLYWIEPLLDATEYTISSTDASGAGFTDHPSTDQNHNGFTGGYAFRPSINSYQYANALAIARLADLSGKPDIAADYKARADRLRTAVLAQLWNPALQHFTDRYQRSTPTVHEGDFIRGRELVGYLPWFFELPPTATGVDYTQAWHHALNPDELAGPHGLRTVEPTYPRYLTQYRYDQASGAPECQWNGPSWPFQTSQALTAMANLLDDYPKSKITPEDYIRLLRQYTHEHLLEPNQPDLQEDYNPDTGRPIVGLARSHHYNHSTYIDLILSGLIGIRPRTDNVLEITPLIPTDGDHPIQYFAVQDLAYHGHQVSLFYDADGTRYHIGKGLSVFVDGHRHSSPTPLQRTSITLGPAVHLVQHVTSREDLAVNVGVPEGVIATASSADTSTAVAEAIDGRLWFFPEIRNGWSSAPTDASPTSWYAIDLRAPRSIGSVELYFFADSHTAPPTSVEVQSRTPTGWRKIPGQQAPVQPLGNGETRITFPALTTQELRLVLTNPAAPAQLRLVEMKAFAPDTP